MEPNFATELFPIATRRQQNPTIELGLGFNLSETMIRDESEIDHVKTTNEDTGKNE